MQEYGLPAYDAEVLTSRKDVADYFEAAVQVHPDDPKAISNWVMDGVLRFINEEGLDAVLKIATWPCPPDHLGQLVGLIHDGTISTTIAKTVYEEMRRTGQPPAAVVEAKGLHQVSDTATLERAIEEVLTANPDKVEAYRGGKDKLIGFFVGQVMRATQGKANPKLVNELLREKLAPSEEQSSSI